MNEKHLKIILYAVVGVAIGMFWFAMGFMVAQDRAKAKIAELEAERERPFAEEVRVLNGNVCSGGTVRDFLRRYGGTSNEEQGNHSFIIVEGIGKHRTNTLYVNTVDGKRYAAAEISSTDGKQYEDIISVVNHIKDLSSGININMADTFVVEAVLAEDKSVKGVKFICKVVE